MLNDIIQRQKDKCCKIMFKQIIERSQIVEQWLSEATESGGMV